MNSALESIELLENKIHFLAVKLTQVVEENNRLKLDLKDRQNKNNILVQEIDSLKTENDRLESIKHLAREKIITLIKQLSQGSDVDKLIKNTLNIENTKENTKVLKKASNNSLKDTVFDFFSEEEL